MTELFRRAFLRGDPDLRSQDPAMFALALALPVFFPCDTLVFNDGTTHILDETSVAPDDDIVVSGNGLQFTTVILTGDLEARTVSMAGSAIVRAESNAKVQEVRTEGQPVVRSTLSVKDSAEVVGAITLDAQSTATLAGSARAGSVDVGLVARFNLSENAVVTGDVISNGTVQVSGGSVLGTMSLARGLLVDETQGPLVFPGPVSIGQGGQLTFQRTRFLSSLEVSSSTRLDFGGTSEVLGVLRLRQFARAIFSVESASVPSGFVTSSAGMLTTVNTSGGQSALSYQRDAQAQLIIERLDEPTSTTVCSQSLPNSTGAAGHVSALGGTFASAGEMLLRAEQLPNNSFSFFFVGDALVQGTAPSGDLCAGGNLGRFVGPGQIMITGQTGSIDVAFDTAEIPGNPASSALPGSTYYFQAWNRDNIGGAAVSRFSDTAAVTFR